MAEAASTVVIERYGPGEVPDAVLAARQQAFSAYGDGTKARDSFDEHSTHFGAWHDGAVIGTGRYITGPGLASDQLYNRLGLTVGAEVFDEPSGFGVVPEARRTIYGAAAYMRLVGAAFKHGEAQRRRWLLTAVHDLLHSLNWVPFVLLCPPVSYAREEGGPGTSHPVWPVLLSPHEAIRATWALEADRATIMFPGDDPPDIPAAEVTAWRERADGNVREISAGLAAFRPATS